MTVQNTVTDYIDKRPYIQEALANDIINYSALARELEDDIEGGFEAIKMALRRYQQEKAQQRIKRHQAITDILGETGIELKNNITVCKTDASHDDLLLQAETDNGPTHIVTGHDDPDHDTIEDQVLVSLSSPTTLEDVPGVIAYITSLVAGRGINITELISCREDTHLIIDEADATTVFTLLNEKLT